MIEQFAASSACDEQPAQELVQSDSVRNSVNNPRACRLAVNQITTTRWSFDEDLSFYREAGFAAAGLWLPKIGEYGEERAVEFVREQEIAVSSLSFAGGFTGTGDSSYLDALAEAREFVKLAGALGAECLVLVSGPQRGHIRSHARKIVVDAVKALSDMAGQRGVALALQPMSPLLAGDASFLNSLDETLELIERSGRAARIAFDVCHLWREHRLVERIAEIAPLVAVVQLSDGGAGSSGEFERLIPSDGEIPLAAIVQAFDDAGYSGYYELAVWSEELWRSDYAETLRKCRVRFDALSRRPLPAPATPL